MKIKSYIKLSYVYGLKDVVMDEIRQYPDFIFSHDGEDSVYLDFTQDLRQVKKLKSVARAYLVVQSPKYNPLYVANHKSLIGDLISVVLSQDGSFKSFKLICAGEETPQVRSIGDYVQTTYALVRQEDADLKIHIIKVAGLWEVGVQITPRPLSMRYYRTNNLSGAMDPTIAFALNSLCNLDIAKSYLNAFSGSGTLLLEAALAFPHLDKLVGFDNNKEHLSLAVRNIKKAGLIKRIRVKEADIFDMPNFGKVDAITADLPFGMLISKGEDLANLYRNFIKFCELSLNASGVVAVYTSEHKLLEGLINDSRFSIVKILELKLMTASKVYLRPQIILCKLN